MSFYFTLKSGDKEFEIGRNLPGLWEDFESLRTNPSENAVVNGEVKSFDGWVIPTKRLSEIYTGLCVINALKPLNHFLMPEFDDGNNATNYWRLLSGIDFEEDTYKHDPRFTIENLNADNEIRAKVYSAYSAFISHGYASTKPSDYDGELSVYFWSFIEDMMKFVRDALENSFNGIPTKFFN